MIFYQKFRRVNRSDLFAVMLLVKQRYGKTSRSAKIELNMFVGGCVIVIVIGHGTKDPTVRIDTANRVKVNFP